MDEDRTEIKTTTSKKSRKKRMLAVKVFVALVLVALVGLSGYLYTELRDVKNNPDKVTQDQVDTLVEKVGKLLVLPTDEQPTVASVKDKEKLAEQPFFSGAENGDKLLIYTNAQKAIIYRESTNSLINVGPVTLDAPVGGEAGTQAQEVTP